MRGFPARVWAGILAGAMILMIGGGLRHSFGLFLPPISEANGWGREVFSLGFAVQMFLLGFGSPLAGMLADRFGSGWVLATGGALQALGLLGAVQAVTPGGFVLTAGIVMGVGASAVSNVAVIGAVSRMAGEDRMSRVVGVMMGGASLGQILALPFAHVLLVTYGWAWAMSIMALVAFMALPLAWVVVRGQPGGERPRPEQRIGEALREARGHPGYRLLIPGFFVCGFHMFFLAAHLPAYTQDLGLAPVVGANALMLVGLFNMIGSNTWGMLGDRFSKRRLLVLIYLLRTGVIAGFMAAPVSPYSVYAFSAGMGFLWLATFPLTSGLVGQMFGRQHLSMLYGIVFIGHQLGGFTGAWLAGFLFDLTGRYSLIWGVAIGLGLFAAGVHLLIDDRRVARLPA